MSFTRPLSEHQLAESLRPWLKSHGWDAYPEVKFEQHGRVADWVACKGELVAVFECKLSFSIEVLQQAFRWTEYADFVSIVIPAPIGDKQRKKREQNYPMLKTLGVGLIEVQGQSIEVVLSSTQRERGRSESLRKACRPEHQELGVPGTSRGERWSPFRQTMREVREFVRENPGCTIKEALTVCDHHWPTKAKGIATMQRIAREESGLPGLSTEELGGMLRLHCKDAGH